MTRRLCMFAALALSACTGDKDPADTAAADDTGEAEPLPEAWTEHYHVESDIRGSGFSFHEVYWARRIVDPEASTIDEEFIAEADGTPTLTAIVVDAAAGSFTLDINEGEYTGEGTLHGEAWAWTSWESRSETSDGSYVLSQDQVTATGLQAAKVGYSAAGEEEWTLDEVLTTVTEAEWQAGIDAIE